MKIKLKGELHDELTSVGCKSGDTIHATADSAGKTGAMYFVTSVNGYRFDCVVWPENYIILDEN